MKRALLAAAMLGCAVVLAGFGGPANFGKEGAGFGRPNTKGGTAAPPITTCGTGVIDLSSGCSITIALGLVP